MFNHERAVWYQREFWDLVFYKAFASLRSDASRYYLNLAWWILDPILSMAVYYVVFGLLLERGGEHFVPLLMIGLVYWNWFGNTVRHCTNAIRAASGLMLQVKIPKVFFPSVTIVIDTIKFLIVMTLLLIFLWIYGFPVSEKYLALPVLMIIQLMLIVGVSYWVAGVVPFLPDLGFLIDAFLILMFFMSGVFYSVKRIPEQYHDLFFLNPMASLISGYRDILMYDSWPVWERMAGVGMFSFVMLVSGYLLIRRFEYQYPRMVGR